MCARYRGTNYRQWAYVCQYISGHELLNFFCNHAGNGLFDPYAFEVKHDKEIVEHGQEFIRIDQEFAIAGIVAWDSDSW